MAHRPTWPPDPRKHPVPWLAAALLPAVVVVLAMVGVYAFLPPPQGGESALALTVFMIVALLVYTGVIVVGVRRLKTSSSPIMEGAIVLSVLATIMILTYSWQYLAIEAADPASFTEPMDKVAAVYFTVTVLTTVGFGDITAVTDGARLMVTFQMILGVTLLTVGVRILTYSTRTSVTSKMKCTKRKRASDELAKSASAAFARHLNQGGRSPGDTDAGSGGESSGQGAG